MIIDKRLVLEYLLMFLLISVSGNPFFSGTNILLLVFLFTLVIFIVRKKKVSKQFIIFISLFLLITFVQSYVFSFFSLMTIFGVIIRITTAYLVVKILDLKFLDYYIKVMYYIAIVSLIFYLISNISISLIMPFSINSSETLSIHSRYSVFGIFTFIESVIYRNCGSFWEPSAFGGYLTIAYVFNFFKVNGVQDKVSIVLLVAILTTVSSTIYIALMIFFFFAYFSKIKNIFLKYLILFVIMYGGYSAFVSLSFLSEKIEQQYEIAKNLKPSQIANSDSQRFINILKDFQDFQGHEFVGRGSNNLTRYSINNENQIRTVGLSDFLVKYGVPFFIFIFYLLYISIKNVLVYLDSYNIMNQLGIFIPILITLTSEVYFNFPFYWALIFLSIIYKQENLIQRNL